MRARLTLSRYTPAALTRIPAKPRALGISPRVTKASPTRTSRLTFHSAVTIEICESFSALDSAIVEIVWHTAKQAHAHTNPGRIGGTPCHSTNRAANGSRKVKRPQTLMYS